MRSDSAADGAVAAVVLAKVIENAFGVARENRAGILVHALDAISRDVGHNDVSQRRS